MVPQAPLLSCDEIRRRLRYVIQQHAIREERSHAASLADLARRLGLDRVWIYNVAANRRPITPRMQQLLSETLADVFVLQMS